MPVRRDPPSSLSRGLTYDNRIAKNPAVGRKHCVLITLVTQLQPELPQLYSITSTSACGTPMLRKTLAWKLGFGLAVRRAASVRLYTRAQLDSG